MSRKLAVVIMAAGKGTRMKNPDKAKVMFEINGRPMVEHVVDLAMKLHADRIVVIVGWQKDSVIGFLARTGKPVICVEQNPQLGTGHAVMQAAAPLKGFAGDVLVLSGDVPLLKFETLSRLIAHHVSSGASATLLTAVVQDPTGYGRILRGQAGEVLGIVEQKDATNSQRAINEINSGIYVFDAGQLFDALAHITPSNAQNEYYLTDVFGHFWSHTLRVSALPAKDPREIQGINTLEQLEEARAAIGASY